MNRRHFRFLADRRGVVSFEVPTVLVLLMLGFIIPLADFTMFGYKYISAFQALRDAGQYMQYNTPLDVTTGTYTLPASASTIGNYTISNIQLLCGTATCSPSNQGSPKYYTFQTSFTLSPTSLMRAVLCTSGASNPCTYTLSYSERFQ